MWGQFTAALSSKSFHKLVAVVSPGLLLPVPGCNSEQAVWSLIKTPCGRLPRLFAILSPLTMRAGRTIDPDTFPPLAVTIATSTDITSIGVAGGSMGAADVSRCHALRHLVYRRLQIARCELQERPQASVCSCMSCAVASSRCSSNPDATCARATWKAIQATGLLFP